MIKTLKNSSEDIDTYTTDIRVLDRINNLLYNYSYMNDKTQNTEIVKVYFMARNVDDHGLRVPLGKYYDFMHQDKALAVRYSGFFKVRLQFDPDSKEAFKYFIADDDDNLWLMLADRKAYKVDYERGNLAPVTWGWSGRETERTEIRLYKTLLSQLSQKTNGGNFMKNVQFGNLEFEDLVATVPVLVQGDLYGKLKYDRDQKAWVLWPLEIDDAVSYDDDLATAESEVLDDLTLNDL